MKGDYPRQNTTMLVWLMVCMVTAFGMQLVLLLPWFGSNSYLTSVLGLSPRAVQQWHLWTLLTHGFLHSTGNPLHIFFSLLGLILIGRELEPQLGAQRLLLLFWGSVVLGAFCWLAVHWRSGGLHIGPSAGIMGMLVVLACIYSRQEIQFMPLFLFRVTLRPLHFVSALLVVDALLLILYELPGAGSTLVYSPSAHLGGMLAGGLFFRLLHASNGWDRASTLRRPEWLNFRRPVTPPPAPDTRPSSSLDLRAEVDRILDKINSQGFGSLTLQEKRLLDEAKEMLSKR